METRNDQFTLQDDLIENLPKDLYIPPDALEIFLETFEGPLDLLLYLIRHQNVDILNIPVAEITRQYIAYIELMKELRLDLAAEYLVMAATLAQIKSRMLLPKHKNVEEEEDPRAALIKRLQEYEQFKRASEKLDQIPRKNRDFFAANVQSYDVEKKLSLPDIDLKELLFALGKVLERVEHKTHHQIRREMLSVRERMTRIISQLDHGEFVPFTQFFEQLEGRQGVIVTFLGILELIKDSVIEVVQSKPFAPVYIKLKGSGASRPL